MGIFTSPERNDFPSEFSSFLSKNMVFLFDFGRLLQKRRLPYVSTPTLRFRKKSTHSPPPNLACFILLYLFCLSSSYPRYMYPYLRRPKEMIFPPNFLLFSQKIWFSYLISGDFCKNVVYRTSVRLRSVFAKNLPAILLRTLRVSYSCTYSALVFVHSVYVSVFTSSTKNIPRNVKNLLSVFYSVVCFYWLISSCFSVFGYIHLSEILGINRFCCVDIFTPP